MERHNFTGETYKTKSNRLRSGKKEEQLRITKIGNHWGKRKTK